jgi:flavin reductase (DIM6/NTAB) family NADH-FMN oxidoreductase RutF
MITIDPKEVSVAKLQGYLQGAIGPRPIAFASTVDKNGKPNLSPFSFFNVFSANPPILVFSPARRVRDNSIKHTLLNCESTKEVVINIVNYEMVQQMSLSSTEYADGVNEFVKSGLTQIASEIVKPYRVAESPVQFECKVNESIDPYKIDLVARLGGNWYSRANEGLFEVEKPNVAIGIGVDMIPNFVKESSVFDGNDLGKLGNIEALPTLEEVTIFVNQNFAVKGVLSADDEIKIHVKAKEYLDNNEVAQAWKVLLAKRI